MTQKEIKEKYMEIMRTEVWPQSVRMQQYAEKEFYYGVELDNGDIYVIEKPRIKKDFCFGYGMYGISTKEDMDGASSMVHHASTSEGYFISKNLEEIEERIERLRDPRKTGYKYCAYSGQEPGSKLKTYTMLDPYDFDRMYRKVDIEEMTAREVKAIADGYEEVRQMFMKRLKTYLKKYGLTKVNAWSYLRD